MADDDDGQILDIHQSVQRIGGWQAVGFVKDDDCRHVNALLELDTEILAGDVHRWITAGEVMEN